MQVDVQVVQKPVGRERVGERERWITGGGEEGSTSPASASTLTTGHLLQDAQCFSVIQHKQREKNPVSSFALQVWFMSK